MAGADELRALGEDIKRNGLQSPIVVQDGVIIDGRNRLDAMELVGMTVIENGRLGGDVPWEILADDEDPYADPVDPYTYVISANIHRRHLTTAQRGELLAAALKATPERSDRAIAKDVKVDHKTVAAKRKELEVGGEIPHQDKRTGADGKVQRTTKAKPKQPKTKPKQPKPITSSPAAPAPPPLAQAAAPPHPDGTLSVLETLAGMYLSASFEDQLALFSGWFAQLTVAQQSEVCEVMGKE
jgi:hypothetical protein